MIIILQYRGISRLSRAIRIMTWSDISHSALARVPDSFAMLCPDDRRETLSNCPVVEAWKNENSVRLVHGAETQHTPGTWISAYAVSAIGFDESACWEFAISCVGAKYDTRGNLGFVSRRDGAQHPDKWFCSELVFSAVREGGVELLARIPAHRVSPGKLDTTPLMYHMVDLNAPAADGPDVYGILRRAQRPCGASATQGTPRYASGLSRHFAPICTRFAAGSRPARAGTFPMWTPRTQKQGVLA